MNIKINTDKSYNIEIKKGLLYEVGTRISTVMKPSRVCVISDITSDKYWGNSLEVSFAGTGFSLYRLVFPEGESTKSMDSLVYILNYLAENGFTRSDCIIGLGGGVIGDLAGFAASVYMRGIPCWQVPTTLLAAVDSSVGGKTAVNLPEGKNLAGTFSQPEGVFFDPTVLSTLPHDEILNGLAEIIKAGIILDEEIITILEENPEESLSYIIEDLIVRSINVKKEIVQLDERENGLRKSLNLGHTIGHAIEKKSGYTVHHGRAVAIGTLAMAKISERQKWTRSNLSYRLEHLYRKYGFDMECPYLPEELAQIALSDKKRRGDIMTMAVPVRIGRCTLKDVHISHLEDLFVQGLEY